VWKDIPEEEEVGGSTSKARASDISDWL